MGSTKDKPTSPRPQPSPQGVKKLIVVREKKSRVIVKVAKDMTEALDYITAETKRSQSPESTLDEQSDYAQLMGQAAPVKHTGLEFELDSMTEVDFYNYLLMNGREW